MVVLFIGDVVGRPGRSAVRRHLPRLRRELAPDLVIVNGENAARGAGMTPSVCEELFGAGADVITSGNHVWDRREVIPLLERDPRVLRPANYPDPSPGHGVFVAESATGTPVAVINLMGRVFMPHVDDPFRMADAILEETARRTPVSIIDFHAEATSEKIAFGWYVDGRASAVLGTHTHVPTADERVLPGGTAYISDVGMTGPHDGIIGVDRDAALERFLTQRPARLSPASGDVRLAGVVVELDDTGGRATSIRRISCDDTGEADS